MNQNKIFLIDLDSIFDTRLGVLYKHSEETANKNLTIEYFNRSLDDFIDLPFEAFKTLYDQRDKTILAYSLKTPMVDLLLDFVSGVYKNCINGYEKSSPKLLINIHPYRLLEAELETIREMFIQLTKGFCLLEFVDLPLEEITPILLKNSVDAFSIYQYTDWLELHSANQNLKKTTIPTVTLFGPRINFKRHTEEEKNFLLTQKIHPFETLEKLTAPFVSLKTLQPYFYSAALLEQAALLSEDKQKQST